MDMKHRKIKGGTARRSERSGTVSRGALSLLLLFALISTASAVTVNSFGGSWGGAHSPGPNTLFQFDTANPVNAPGANIGTNKFTDSLTVGLVGYSAAVGVTPPGSAANNVTLGNLVIRDSITTLVVGEFALPNARLFQIVGAPFGFGLIQADMAYISHGNATIDTEMVNFIANGGRFGLSFNGSLFVNSNGTVTLDQTIMPTASYSAVVKTVPEPANLTMALSGVWLLVTSGWLIRRDRRAKEQGSSQALSADKQL
jgi:hypothetical protein